MTRKLLPWCGLMLAVWALGCPPPEFADGFERRECPKEWQFDTTRVLVPGGRLSTPGAVQNVPEFHDCQRFLVQDGRTGQLAYDSIFAIFAAYNLQVLDTLALLDTLPQDSLTLRAVLSRASRGLTGEEWAAAALIWAPDNGYEPLAIEQGLNCLYLRSSGGRWIASMVPMGFADTSCSKPQPSERVAGTDLEVYVTVAEKALANEVPAAAKWDWDEQSKEQYIGIRCGASWCDVGRRGFQPSKPYLAGIPDNASLPAKKRRVYGIKGWYDQQYLATIPEAGDGVVHTDILGTLFPDPDLGGRGDADFEDQWVPGAEVALEVPSDTENPYYDKYYFAGTRPGDTMLNTIELCHGQNCPGLTHADACSAYDDWWAKITRADDGAVKYRCVSRCDLSAESGAGGFSVPGTARWRWLAQDEKTWMRCAQGCCETR